MLIEIDFNKTTRGQTEMRTGHMRALVDAGHTIKLLTPMGKDSIASYNHIKEGGDPAELGTWDTSWFSSVDYEPESDASDCDLLLVESAACNWMFHYKGQQSIRRCAEILDSYKGKVIVDQSDPDLPFPFGKMGCAKRKYSHKKNPYRLGEEKGHQDLETYGWADPKEIWDDKEYYVIVRSEDMEAVHNMKMFNGKRFQYSKLVNEEKITILGLPQTWDFENHSAGIEFNPDANMDFVFAGYPRGPKRERKFREIFLESDIALDKAVSGPWEKDSRSDMKVELDYNCIDYAGNLSWRGLLEFLNNAKFSMYLGVSKAYKMNWQTNKPFESISSGAILVFDDEIQYLKDWFGDNFIIGPDNLDWWSYFMRNITTEEREVIWKWQYKQIAGKTWEWFVFLWAAEMDVDGVLDIDSVAGGSLEHKRSKKVSAIFKKYRELFATVAVSPVLEEQRVEKKAKFFAKIAEEYTAPECHGEQYDAEDTMCTVDCPFAATCMQLCNNAPEPPEDVPNGSEEVPDAIPPTTTAPLDEAEIINVEPPHVQTHRDSAGNISTLVIDVRNADGIQTLHIHL
jgi:hypothetical protein